MPLESIMDMVNNISPMHDDKNSLYSKWIREGDSWDRKAAFAEARALAGHFAESLESGLVRGKYTEGDINEAAREMIEEFITEELPKWSKVEKTEPFEKPRPMTQYEIEQARKYEALAYEIGFDRLKALLPVSSERIRAALLRGDRGLRSIPLRKWDAAAAAIRMPGLTISDKVGLLKHVAAWHTD